MTERLDAYAVILAGGSGTRFWPVSTPDRPKQLLPLASDRSLLSDTIDRAARLVGDERFFIVASDRLVKQFRAALGQLDEARLLREPSPRGTAPALAMAAHHLLNLDPDCLMVSLHADHVIHPFEEFRSTIQRGLAACREGRLCCIGAHPSRPETGYGYVRRGPATAPGTFVVEEFVEKPDAPTAERYLASGDFLWNTGIFVWRAADLLEAIRRYTPEGAGALARLDAGDVPGFFEAVTPISIDEGVMERAEAVGVVEASFAWDDVGVWNSLARTRSPDRAGNVVVGDARLVDARENIVWTEDTRATLFDVEGLVVVQAGREILVTTRTAADRLKSLLDRLREEPE